MESQRNPVEKEKKELKEVKEPCSLAFEAFWAKGIEFYFKAYLDGSLPAREKIILWLHAKKDKETTQRWYTSLEDEKQRSGESFPIKKEVLLGILAWEITHTIDYASSCFERAAKTNDSTAQYYLGLLNQLDPKIAADNPIPCPAANTLLGRAYHSGGIRAANPTLSLIYYTRAADLGHTGALHYLGEKILKEGGADDEGLRYLRQAVSGGNYQALMTLAIQYRAGRGVPKDEKEADRLYDLAAEVSPTHFHLTPFREFYSRPLEEFIIAAESGDLLKMIDLFRRLEVENETDIKIVREQLQQLLKLKKEIETENKLFPVNKQVLMGFLFYVIKDYDRAEICFSTFKATNTNADFWRAKIQQKSDQDQDEDQEAAIKRYEEIIKRSPLHPTALYELGRIYYGKKNYPLALHYLTQADKAELPGPAFMLGNMHHYAIGVAKNIDMALQYYSKAATKGSFYALAALGCMSNNARDYTEAVRLLRLPAEFGVQSARYVLGHLFYHGFGVSKDGNEAMRLLSLACAQVDYYPATAFLSSTQLGQLYAGDDYKEFKDPELSASYFRRAAEKNDAKARKGLTKLFNENPNHPVVICQAATTIREQKMLQALNTLAETDPAAFDAFADQNSWEKIKPLLSEETANKIYARLQETAAQRQFNVEEMTSFPPNVSTLISRFVGDESYQGDLKTRVLVMQIQPLMAKILNGDQKSVITLYDILDKLSDSKFLDLEAQGIVQKRNELAQKEMKEVLSDPEQLLLGISSYFQGANYFQKAIDYLTQLAVKKNAIAIELLEKIYQREIKQLSLRVNLDAPFTNIILLYLRIQALLRLNPKLCTEIMSQQHEKLKTKEAKEISADEKILLMIFNCIELKQKVLSNDDRAPIELHAELTEFSKSTSGKALALYWCEELKSQHCLSSSDKILLGILNDITRIQSSSVPPTATGWYSWQRSLNRAKSKPELIETKNTP